MTALSLAQVATMFPIGSEVFYFPVSGDDSPEYQHAEIRSEPWVLGSGDTVIKITGRTGGVHVGHLVRVVKENSPYPIGTGRLTMGGTEYLPDAKGSLVPVKLINPQHLLEDELVRKIVGYAISLSDQVSRFKQHTFADLTDFEALLAQEYELTKGGKKGNKTFMSHDGLFKVQVAVADLVEFGPELQIAKGLFDECLNEWSADARDELRVFVTRAFNTDKEGKINRAEIYSLLRMESTDERWQRAIKATRDAIRPVATKAYVRCYQRPTQDAGWQAITIDLAKA
jgi:hypothetical protein